MPDTLGSIVPPGAAGREWIGFPMIPAAAGYRAVLGRRRAIGVKSNPRYRKNKTKPAHPERADLFQRAGSHLIEVIDKPPQNSLSLWKRGRVREARKGHPIGFSYNRLNSSVLVI